MELPLWFYQFFPLAVLSLILLEAGAARVTRRRVHRLTDSLASLTAYGGYIIMAGLYAYLAWYGLAWLNEASPLPVAGKTGSLFANWSAWQLWAFVFLAEDFCFYWFHRASHKISWLWTFHDTHHSSDQFNLTTGVRQNWFVFAVLFFYIPLALLGIPPEMILAAQTLSLSYQFLLHSRLYNFPRWWGLIFNTPSHHRVHHGSQPPCLDKNFGGVLIVWDYLFGSFQKEPKKINYGTNPPLKNDHPLYIQLRGWHEWARQLIRKGSQTTAAKPSPTARFSAWFSVRGLVYVLGSFLLAVSSLRHPQWFLVGTFSCAAPLKKVQKEYIFRNIAKVSSYQGVYRETGVATRAVETKIAWSAEGNRFQALVTDGPRKLKGSVVSFDGSNLAVYYPATRFGYVFKNLEPVNVDEQLAYLNENYDWHLNTYHTIVGENTSLAGHPATRLTYQPKQPRQPYLYTWKILAHRDYSFPLSLSRYPTSTGAAKSTETGVANKNQADYEFVYKSIQFNKVPADFEFGYRFPGGATVGRWNLKSAAYTPAQARKYANFRLTLPAGDFADTPLKKIVRVAGVVPGFTAYYRQGPWLAFYSQIKDYGLPLIPIRGIKKATKTGDVYVNYFGPFTSVYFKRAGVHHTLLSNRPLNEVLESLEAGG